MASSIIEVVTSCLDHGFGAASHAGNLYFTIKSEKRAEAAQPLLDKQTEAAIKTEEGRQQDSIKYRESLDAQVAKENALKAGIQKTNEYMDDLRKREREIYEAIQASKDPEEKKSLLEIWKALLKECKA